MLGAVAAAALLVVRLLAATRGLALALPSHILQLQCPSPKQCHFCIVAVVEVLGHQSTSIKQAGVVV